MSTVKVQGNAGGTGSITLASPNTNNNRTIEFPDVDGTAVVANASGNVGIGTSSPQSTFQVGSINSGTSESTNKGLVQIQSAPSTIDSAGGLEFKTSSSNSGYGWKIGGLNASSDPFVIGNRANSASFTERIRIDSNGNFMVGTTSVLSYAKVGISFNGTTSNAIVLNDSVSANGAGYAYFQIGGTTIGSITRVGTGSTVSYATSSDYRLKENVQPMTGALAVVQQLKPCTYTWKADGSDGQGFIAHELAEVCPDAVVGEKDAVNEDGSIKAQGIDTSFLVATLTAAIQELKAELDAAKADIAALKGAA